MSTSGLSSMDDLVAVEANSMNFDEVKVHADDRTDLEILKKLCEERETEEPFHLLDLGDIVRKHTQWTRKMPRVLPYYAVKCNPHPLVIKTIAALNGSFDCASKNEMDLVMSLGVSSDRIIYANPIKFKGHLQHAKNANVSLLVADTEAELEKIKDIHPRAKILIRFRCDGSKSGAQLGEKYGCDARNEAPELIKFTNRLGLELAGFSFHVGSPCYEPMAFVRGIKLAQGLIDAARSTGCERAGIIDIGGGISGERLSSLDEFSDAINDALKTIDPSVKVIAEPGRYYVDSAFTSASLIFGKKVIEDGGRKSFQYYLSDGCYNSFYGNLLKIKERYPISIYDPESLYRRRYSSTLWGPTCDSYDAVLKDKPLPEYHLGDWLAWYDMGAYTSTLSTDFNGFQFLNYYPFIRSKERATLMKGSEKRIREVRSSTTGTPVERTLH